MGDADSSHVLSALIGSIYDYGLEPGLCEGTLFQIRDALDEPYVLARHTTRNYAEASPYIQECLRPQGIVDVIQFILLHTPSQPSGIAFARHERQGIITEQEIELGELLLPHLRRAVTISDVLDANAIKRARMAEALDVLRCGVVLTDERATILHANRSAEEMLHNGGLIQERHGVLTARVPEATKELRHAIQLAAMNEAPLGKPGLEVRLTGPDVPPVLAHVLPMTGSDERTRLPPTAAAAVFVGAPTDEQDSAGTMARVYGLTPAEKRVLVSLLAGRTLAETARALNIAVTTAKTHLKNIFSKTGVSRQTELVRLASHVASPSRSAS